MTVPLPGTGAVVFAPLAERRRRRPRPGCAGCSCCCASRAPRSPPPLSRVFARRVMAPVADLTAAAEHIEATGDLDRRIDGAGRTSSAASRGASTRCSTARRSQARSRVAARSAADRRRVARAAHAGDEPADERGGPARRAGPHRCRARRAARRRRRPGRGARRARRGHHRARPRRRRGRAGRGRPPRPARARGRRARAPPRAGRRVRDAGRASTATTTPGPPCTAPPTCSARPTKDRPRSPTSRPSWAGRRSLPPATRRATSRCSSGRWWATDRAAILIDHDDADREAAYASEAGTFEATEAITVTAARLGWTTVSVAHDWDVVFPGGISGRKLLPSPRRNPPQRILRADVGRHSGRLRSRSRQVQARLARHRGLRLHAQEGPERGGRPRDLVEEVRARVDDEVPAQRAEALRAQADARVVRQEHARHRLRRHLLLHQAHRAVRSTTGTCSPRR